jgi:uncharacterized membrane protein
MAPISVTKLLLPLLAAHHAVGLSLRANSSADSVVVANSTADTEWLDPVHRLGEKIKDGFPAEGRLAKKSATPEEPAMTFRGKLSMAAALLGTPLILFLLRTDMLRQPSLSVVLVVTGLYIFASLAMNVLNKKAAKAFEATCLLVIIQMLVSVVVIICMEYDKMKMDKWADFMSG